MRPRSTGFWYLAVMAAILLTAMSCSDPDSLIRRDETEEARKLVEEANRKLKEIRKLYYDNEVIRYDLADALSSRNPERVRELSTKAFQLINEGSNTARDARNLIRDAQQKNITPEFRKYLELKEEAMSKQIEAFSHFHKAARILRDNYDPNNDEARKKVVAEFGESNDEYLRLMEEARSKSREANELYKDTIKKKR